MTSRGTWKKAEAEVAKFHNPVEGRRTPLSGINSGHTHADCMGVEGIFIEQKYRKAFALWKLYMATAKLAKKECKVPVVSIKEKGKKGFIDLIHTDHLDCFVQMYIRNRCIHVESSTNVMVGETVLTKFFSGTPMQVKFLMKYLNHFAFNKEGQLRENWWTLPGEKLAITMQLSEGFSTVLYGSFNVPMTVDPVILSEDVRNAIKQLESFKTV